MLQTLRARPLLVAALGLLVLATLARLLTYQRYLPFIDHGDEPVYYLIAQNWRGLQNNEFVRWRYAGIPPAYPLINWGIQSAVELLSPRGWYFASDYWYTLRFAAVLAGIATTALLMWAGWNLAGPVGGLFAGLIWGLSPLIVANNSYAIPDPFVYLASAAGLAFAIRAWVTKQPGWLLASLIGGLFAVYLKYSPIGALVPWGIVSLLLFLRAPRRMLPWLALYAVVAGLAAYWLLSVYGALNIPTREVETFRGPESLALMLNLERNRNNWAYAILPFGHTLFAVVMLLGAVAYLVSRTRRAATVPILWAGIILLSGVVGIIMTASYTYISLEKLRHALPTTVALTVLFGMAVAQIGLTVRDLLCLRVTQRQALGFSAAAVCLIGLIVGAPAAAADVDTVRQFQRVDLRQIVWEWADSSLPNDGMVLTHPVSLFHHVFNRDWSGYNGATSFLWWHDENLDGDPASWAAQGVAYFIADEYDASTRFAPGRADQFTRGLTLLKTFQSGEDVRGFPTRIYRILPPQEQADAPFGPTIRLAGYDLSSTRVRPGESITLRPYWRASQRPAANYSAFVHLYPAPDAPITLLAQADGAPAKPTRPTLTWDDPEELIIGADLTLTLPADLPSGTYQLALGLYDFVTGERLLLTDGNSFFAIPITVGE